MTNMPLASTMPSRSRMLFWVAVIAVGLFVYHNSRVADDETTCVADSLFSTGAASPSCYPPVAGEGIVICEIPEGRRFLLEGQQYSGEVDTETCRRHSWVGW